MKRIHTSSTSASSAACSPIILRTTATTRLIFRPAIVDNLHDTQACVRGSFIFQKKGIKDTWEDVKETNLAELKKAEGIELELHSGEVLALYQGVSALYGIHRTYGVPYGDQVFVNPRLTLHHVLGLRDDELANLGRATVAALSRLVRWAINQRDLPDMLDELEGADVEAVKSLSSVVGVKALRAAVAVWRANSSSASEEFWQKTLVEHSIVLEQLFAFPIVIIQGKAYIGGKAFDNSGGSVVDYLMKNELTHNAALVEIKTPCTPLLGSKYRDGVYNLSTELTGSVMQVLNYRKVFTQKLDSLVTESQSVIDSCDPPCLVVIGNARCELNSPDKRKSFELFRRQISGVEVVTYDELFGKRLIFGVLPPLGEGS